MFRAIFLTIIFLTTTLASPTPLTRTTFTCSNQCYPIPNFPCPSPCVAKRCTFRLNFPGLVGIPGTACTRPPPSPSSTPTPSPTPSPVPVIQSCSFNVIGNLLFTCDCTTTTGNTAAEVDVGSKFSGTNRFSKGCFETCLAGYALPECETNKDLPAFEAAINRNFHFCCSSCDAEVISGVCVPFEN